MSTDDFLHGGLIEDCDGAPYPEHVQEVVRCLTGEIVRLRDQLKAVAVMAEPGPGQASIGVVYKVLEGWLV